MTSSRKGLFLDFDGTLADSIPVMFEVYARFLALHDRPASQAEFDSLNGPTFDVVIRTLKETHNLSPSTSALTTQYFDVREDLKHSIEPTLGAEELVQIAIQSHYSIAVVTSSQSSDVEQWLDKFGLSKDIKTVVGGESVAQGKPAPDPYLLALERTGCAARSSLAVEDSLPGIRSAQEAGLYTIAIGHEKSISAAQPDIVTVSNLKEVIGYLNDT